MAGRKPTHELKVKDTETGDTCRVAVAWFNEEDGSFGIKLQPCTVLTYDSMKGKVLTLFPIKTDAEWAAHHAQKNRRPVPGDGAV
jgi:hypothetical protein